MIATNSMRVNLRFFHVPNWLKIAAHSLLLNVEIHAYTENNAHICKVAGIPEVTSAPKAYLFFLQLQAGPIFSARNQCLNCVSSRQFCGITLTIGRRG